MAPGVLSEIPEEKEKEILRRVLKTIREKGAEDMALLILLTWRPVSRLGGMMSRFLLGPLVPILNQGTEAWIWTLEKEHNVEWLIERLESGDDAAEE